jgi:hypothetical protein
MTKDRLSSDNLFHFTGNVDKLESIFKSGFRHNLMETETFPYKGSIAQNFCVCFCDIRYEDSEFHRSVYGNNAIILTKDWGITNGVSPVRYIHENSPGVNSRYVLMKNLFRELTHPSPRGVRSLDYLAASIQLLDGDNSKIPVDDNWGRLLRAEDLQPTLESLGAFIAKLSSGDKEMFFVALSSLYARISELHNELENRDSFQRAYKEDFRGIIKKVLYDEREWRSIRYIDEAYENAHGGSYKDAMNNKFLPLDFNLKFNDSDIVAILVADTATKDRIKNYIASNATLLSPAVTDMIIEFDQYKE